MNASGTFQTVGLRLLSGAAVRRRATPAPAETLGVTAWAKPPPLKVPNKLVNVWLMAIAGFVLLTACAEFLGG